MTEDEPGPGPGVEAGPDRGRPAMHVLSGDASAEEVAALVAALTTRTGHHIQERSALPTAWADWSRYLRTTLPHGPDAWRDSSRPR